jgi:hypothetical protein
MTVQNGSDVPQIHPSKIRVGDIIGTRHSSPLRYTVKLISGPRTDPQQWTFFGRDHDGQHHTSTFGENELVCRYAKAS